jgi:hypothetical protein
LGVVSAIVLAQRSRALGWIFFFFLKLKNKKKTTNKNKNPKK